MNSTENSLPRWGNTQQAKRLMVNKWETFMKNETTTIALTKEDILSILQQNRDRLKTYGVKKIGLYGSFVRNEQNTVSDIDFLVEFESGQKTFKNFMGLSFFLEELFGREIELLTKESLSPYIGPHIREEVEYVFFSGCVSLPL